MMLTDGEVLEISSRVETNTATKEDWRKLIENQEELADKLSDCWILLDEIARCVPVPAVERLLRRHGAPGWKEQVAGSEGYR